MTTGIVPPPRPIEAPPEPRLGGENQQKGSRAASADADTGGAPNTGCGPCRLPFCIDCAEHSFNLLEGANDQLDEPERASRAQLRLQAQLEANMVRFLGDWVCPRCEQVNVGTTLRPQLISLQELLPNREARRAFERWASRSTHGSEEALR